MAEEMIDDAVEFWEKVRAEDNVLIKFKIKFGAVYKCSMTSARMIILHGGAVIHLSLSCTVFKSKWMILSLLTLTPSGK